MNRFRALADDQRFLWCLLLSAVLTPIGLGLLGRAWEPRRVDAGPTQEHYIKIAVLPTPKKRIVAKPIAPRPVKKIAPKPVIVKKTVAPKPRRVVPKAVQLRATLQAPSPRHNPVQAKTEAAPGGAPSAVPVLAASPVSPHAIPAPPTQVPVVTVPRSQITVPIAPPAALNTPPIATAPAPAASGGSGVASSGQGAGSGSGAGSGTGQGVGNGAGGGPFGIGSGGTGAGEGSRHIVYVLDLSGSMTSRIDRARQELRDSLASLGSDESFDIITFSDVVHVFDTRLDPVTPANIQRADYFLTTLLVNGGTNLEGALTYALQIPNVNVVFVITDGVPTIDKNGNAIDNIGRYMHGLPRRIRDLNTSHARIYTIGLVGKDPDGHDESFEAADLLKQIARDSGGVSKIVAVGVASP